MEGAMALSQGTGPTCCDIAGRKLRKKHSDLTPFLSNDLLLLPSIGQVQLKAKGCGACSPLRSASLGTE